MPNGTFLEDGVCGGCGRYNLYFAPEPLQGEERLCIFCVREQTLREYDLLLARWLSRLGTCVRYVSEYFVSSESSLRVGLRRKVLVCILRGGPYRSRPITLGLDNELLRGSSQVSVLDWVLDFCVGEQTL